MSFSAVKAGEAFVEIALRGRDKFEAQIDAAQKKLARIASAMAKITAAAGAAATATAGFGLVLAKNAAAAGDAIEKMAARTGASAEFLSQMGFAAEQSGSSLDTLGNALFRMRRRVANAAMETGPAVRAMKELGLAAEDLTADNVETQFNRVVQALSGVDNESTRAQYAFEIFGDQAKALVPLLNAGTDGIDRLRREADYLGRTIGTDQAAAAAQFSDALNRIKTVLGGLTREIGMSMLPTLTHWANELLVVRGVMNQMAKESALAEVDVDNLGAAFNDATAPAETMIATLYRLYGAARQVQAGMADLASEVIRVVGVMMSDSPEGFESKMDKVAAKTAGKLKNLAEAQRALAEENFGLADSDKIRDMLRTERKKLEEFRDAAVLDIGEPFDELKEAVKDAADAFRAQAVPDALEKGTIEAVRKSAELDQRLWQQSLAVEKQQLTTLQQIDRNSQISGIKMEIVG